MINPLSPVSSDPTFALLEQATRFTERRQTVLAGNIANINTPNYKTRDLPVADFQKAVEDALMREQTAGTSLDSSKNPLPESERFAPELFQAHEVGRNHLTFQDGGNRNLEQETTEMSKNAIQHRMTVELLSARMRLMETVISGRP
jgi:flagellar basal-body rod protein FlgB